MFIVFLMSTFVVIGGEQVSYLNSYPAAWFLSLVLLAAVAVPAGFIIYRFDQFEPEPAWMIFVAVAWGGVIAIAFASLSNTFLLSFLQHHLSANTYEAWGAAIVAPINEEFYKGAGLVLLFLLAKDEINSLMDGLVYGAMIGLGFQVVENVQYFLRAAVVAHGQLTAVVNTYFIRVGVAGLYSHTLFTGLMGFGFAFAVTRKSAPRAKRIGVLAIFALLAWGAHFIWNSPVLDAPLGQSNISFLVSVIIKGVPFLLFIIVLALVARRREREAFDRLIAVEVGSDVVTQQEFKTLERGSARRAAQREVARRRGPAAKMNLRRLQREQMNLAVLHGRVGPNDPALERQRDKIRELKAELAVSG